ncbi:FAD-binding oxidoreductase [uncultured Cohaesibacter sp.]|uniref:NAD(P)/FAD-dependent oxidoreductase n=1 Tax=uncultured Cohaesibacter sp. TaxID=1002546 RepID=UPI00292D38CA|nr:FAD-binding oxidoreductase [uncultured Cohaesibacter sp.]
MSYDVIVLGAGIVGISTALHLQERGLRVAVLDRQEPGLEASYGNAGIIEKDGHMPLVIPSEIIPLMKYGSNQQVAMRYHPTMMPRLAPWLLDMWKVSSPYGISSYARRVTPLRRVSATEHFHFADQAGIRDAFRENGWIHLFHSQKTFDGTSRSRSYADELGIEYDVLRKSELSALEPSVRFKENDWGIHWKGCVSVSSPGRVTRAYADLFTAKGGRLVIGDAKSLRQDGGQWTVSSQDGAVTAPKMVVALGAWSMDVLKFFGYKFPLQVKRGYHQHFGSDQGASMSRPVVDEDIGFLLTPMDDGIRLTSGIEFAHREARKTPVQIRKATQWARKIYPLGKPVEDEAWMGFRPCFPDSLPLIEKSDKHEGLYFNFGHGHMGFAVGPITGKMTADLVTGETPCLDVGGFSSKRFF